MTFQTQFQGQPVASNDSLLISFLNQFVNQEFLEDIVNVSLYHADLNAFNQKQSQMSTLDRIKLFLNEINQDIDRLKRVNSLGNYPIKVIKLNIQFAKRVIELRNTVGQKLLTYDTLENSFAKNEIQILSMIKRVKDTRIKNIDEFKDRLQIILNKIQIGDEIRSIKTSIMALDEVRATLNTKDVQVLDVLCSYRNAIDSANADLTKLKSVNLSESLSNSITIGDSESIDTAVDNLVQYLSSGYAFFKTGYDIIDDNIGGIEAGNLHLICGPSNNAKSIFMINLLYKMAEMNKHEFDGNDIIIYITLEDDIYKLLRRFGSILGNIDHTVLKEMYVSASDMLRKKSVYSVGDSNATINAKRLFKQFIQESLYQTTGVHIPFALYHYRDQISPSTVKQLIEFHKSRGKRVRLVYIDYMDCMTPSTSKYSEYNDYNTQGIITQELRNVAQEYLVPVITITQATRGTENADFMTNDNIGDSIKKVRYADYIYMVRLCRGLNILSEEVKPHIMDATELQNNTTTFSDLQNQNNSKLLPFEIKITKAKDGDRDMSRYHIFSGHNLRVHQQLSAYYVDVPAMQINSTKLRAAINQARMSAQTMATLINSSEENLLL